MRWRPTARFLSLVLALPVLMGPTVKARSGQPGPPSRVRVWTYMTGPIDPADRDRSTQVADALLETAGVIVDWHLCDGPGGLRERERDGSERDGDPDVGRTPDVRPDDFRA